jgi:hypothetical protein
MTLKNWKALMSATGRRVERQPIRTLIHPIYPKKVLLQKQNLEVVVYEQEGHPPKIQTMVEIKTLQRK